MTTGSPLRIGIVASGTVVPAWQAEVLRNLTKGLEVHLAVFVATGVSVADNMIKRNPALGAEYKLLLKDSPNFIGVAKGEDALRLKVNEIIVAAKKAGELDAMAKKWLGRPAGTLPE